MPITKPTDVATKPEVERLLAAAGAAISEVPYCWVVTSAQDNGAHAASPKPSRTKIANHGGHAGL